MTKLWLLIALTSSGEYVERRNLTIEQCIGWLVKSREAAAWVAEKHPEIVVKYRCEPV